VKSQGIEDYILDTNCGKVLEFASIRYDYSGCLTAPLSHPTIRKKSPSTFAITIGS
jgi:hypothetical protein